MPVDASIYGQIQQPNIMGAVNDGLRMSDLVQQRKVANKKMQDQATLADIARGSVVTNADGTQTLDQGAFATKAAQAGLADPAMQAAQQNRQYALEQDKINQQMADRADAREERRSLFGLSLQDRRDARADRARQNAIAEQQGLVDQNGKDALLLDKHLSQGWAGRGGQAGMVQAKLNSAEAAEQLLEQAKSQPGGLDSRQIEELAQATGKLLSGGGAQASARIEGLVPHTWYGAKQSLQEYLSGHPQGQGMEDFTARMGETIAREKALAQDQMRAFQIEGLPAFANFAKRDPQGYAKQLAAKGLDASMIDANGRYKKPGAPAPQASAGDDKEATAWALANPNDPRSMQILKANGYSLGKK